MAINTCCDDKPSLEISPRISFSHDHRHTAPAPVEDPHAPDTCVLDSSPDFVFCIQNGVAHKLSSADELFSNGKIVPTQINRVSISNEPHRHPMATGKKLLKEFLSEPDEDNDNNNNNNDNNNNNIVMQERANSVSSFWRSSSVNCDGATRGKSMLRSSMQFLSRSYSTGSAPSTPKHAVVVKQTHRLQKQSSGSSLSFSSSSSASSSAYYFYDSCQKPSLNKNFGSTSGKGVRISPVLNLPHHKATRSVFGFGSLFCNGKFKIKGRNRKS
ncbi:probable serine/threonine-protein kinase DDB_G0280133 [Cajanus cajan]|uniref:Uncharacterized protein n=1 Tax=Cajanus cajan TaxID=3821 RepID=A0A151R1G8_CAJCA|nr:probable serine/threonine-protein kinase DDB_G0280133 [Cajanus cajan]KYP36414.1 hypothetical protein KK1_042461 [Cajanus cajan]